MTAISVPNLSDECRHGEAQGRNFKAQCGEEQQHVLVAVTPELDQDAKPDAPWLQTERRVR